MSGGAGYTTYFRALDPRIGRWLTPDPKVFPWQSPYVSMDGNPVALIDPWGASTGGGDSNMLGEVTVVGKAPQTPTSSSSALQPSIVNVGALSPVSVSSAIPMNYAFKNDATKVANRFISNLVSQDINRAQVNTEYERNVGWLSQLGGQLADFLYELDSNLQGEGSDANWNADGLLQFYREGGGAGQAIHVKGQPTLSDAETVPGQIGLGPRLGKRSIGYIGRGNGKSPAKELLGAAGMGAKTLEEGNNSQLLEIAIEAVKGNLEAENRSVVRISTKNEIYVKIKFFIAKSDNHRWASFDTNYAKNDTMGHVEFYFSDKGYSRIDSIKHIYRLKDGLYEW